MRPGPSYLLASVALGFVSVWGSENLFWTAPPDGLTVAEFLLTWGGYTLVAAAALSIAIWSGLGGWQGAFLGGALLGFGVEGALVGTMYDAFPVQVVWTPLAWHALVTGLAVLALPLWLARARLWVQVCGLLLLGALGGIWGLFWPTERTDLPGVAALLLYLPGLSLGVVAGQVALLRLSPAGRFGGWLWIAPAGVVALWLVQGGLAPSPLRLCWPVLVGATIWAMRRLGSGTRAWPGFGPGVPVRRLLLFPLAPLVTAWIAAEGWRALGAVAVNVPVALATGAAGLGLWSWLIFRAVRRRPVSP